MDVIYSAGYISICMRIGGRQKSTISSRITDTLLTTIVQPSLILSGAANFMCDISLFVLYSTRAITSIRRGNRSSTPAAITAVQYIRLKIGGQKKRQQEDKQRTEGEKIIVFRQHNETIRGEYIRNDSIGFITCFRRAAFSPNLYTSPILHILFSDKVLVRLFVSLKLHIITSGRNRK